jgi:hypothetical protein
MTMNINILRALIEAGAIKRISIIGEGSFFRIEAATPTGVNTVNTLKGKLKTWTNLDAAVKWLHNLGIGNCELNISRWQPEQKGMKL